MKNIKFLSRICLLLTAVVFFSAQNVYAHCDGLDGPVVQSAKKAIETGNVNLVLVWVKKDYEEEIKSAFKKTLEVRKLNGQAREMADMYFYETLVRLHRQGEGAPYTGLKPAGRDLGPAIPLADKSIGKKSIRELYDMLNENMHDGLHKLFEEVVSKKDFNKDDVAAGREYTDAYVKFVHYVERISEATKLSNDTHHSETEVKEKHSH